MNEHLPFAVVGSSEFVKVGSKMTRARQYPWGVVQGNILQMIALLAKFMKFGQFGQSKLFLQKKIFNFLRQLLDLQGVLDIR